MCEYSSEGFKLFFWSFKIEFTFPLSKKEPDFFVSSFSATRVPVQICMFCSSHKMRVGRICAPLAGWPLPCI